MYRTNTKVKGVGKLTTLLVAGLLFVFGYNATFAQPHVPVLSLTGQNGGYNDQWFPNGRIIMPKNLGFEREILVPVFIDNRWHKDNSRYVVDLPIEPIKSFQFKLYYDSSTVRPIGIETTHPKYIPTSATFDDPLADGFQIDWDDRQDKQYYTHLDPLSTATINRGRSITITASNNQPLPNTNLDFQQFKVLLYVRFRIIPEQNNLGGISQFTALHIGRDSIIYNDLNILQNAPFVDYRDYDPQVALDFPNPQRPNYASNLGAQFTGLAGIDNRLLLPPKNVTLPGAIWLQIMDKQPELTFEINRQVGQQPPIDTVPGVTGLWELKDPMTVDLNPNRNPIPFPDVATREIEVLNSTAGTLLRNIEVRSDQPWLKFQTVIGQGAQNPIPTPITEDYIPYIDNGVLGEPSQFDDRGLVPNDLGSITLRIICDPAEIQPGEDTQDDPEIEKTGIYTGYITFSSYNAGISPVRIKVTFIYFRPPLEGQSTNGSKINGILLQVANRDGDRDSLIFGTGDRATLGIDSLYGETPYTFPLLQDQLDARFYPVNSAGEEIDSIAQFGIADFASNDEQRKANSRDIRSSDDTTRSLIYKVKFNPGDDNKDQRYPIILEWNTQDFIEGSQAYIRDTQNGQAFAPVDMITEGTIISQYRRSFKIDDPRIREFIIEYTPAKIIDYTDDEGNPLIQTGWNLLSLPVKSLNLDYENVYPNALNQPYYYFLNSYQEEQKLRAGVGYFVKFGATVDKTFKGTTIFEVSPTLNPVRVYVADPGKGGWNTIGAPSTPLNVEAIEFRAYNNGQRPNKTYTLEKGLWAYRTARGYYEVSELTPGLGYWAKVDQDGYYYFNTSNSKLTNEESVMFAHRNDIKANSTKLVIADNNQSKFELFVSNDNNVNTSSFELPPVAPSFDVRFADNTLLSNSNENIIQLNNVVYPVSISAKGMNGTFELTDAATGEYFGTISSKDFTSIEINNSSNSIRVNKVETEESITENAVYPNPVVATSNVNFDLPEEGLVNVTLIDAVGNVVSNIFSGNKNEGNNTVYLNSNGLASGNYFVKVESGTYNKVFRVQIVK